MSKLGIETNLAIRFNSCLYGFDSIQYRLVNNISFKMFVLQTWNPGFNINAGN